MDFFDAVRGAAGALAGLEAHQAFNGALQNTSIGGLGGLLAQLQQGGLADAVASWRQGEHIPVTAQEIRGALGEQHVRSIAQQLGLPIDQLSPLLSQHLPALATAHAADPQAAGSAIGAAAGAGAAPQPAATPAVGEEWRKLLM